MNFTRITKNIAHNCVWFRYSSEIFKLILFIYLNSTVLAYLTNRSGPLRWFGFIKEVPEHPYDVEKSV